MWSPMALATETRRTAEVFLNPGDFHFHCPAPARAQPTRLRTLLGSCVSVILWHPERRIGGMSHVILPSRSRPVNACGLDGRYGDEAIAMFHKEILRAGTLARQYQVFIVGGGQMYRTANDLFSVGARNVEAVRIHLRQAGFMVLAEHVGSMHHRKVELDLTTGAVSVIWNNKHSQISLG